MRFKIPILVVAAVLLLWLGGVIPCFAQDTVPPPEVHNSMVATIFSWAFLKRCLEIGLGIFAFIQGLKNVPFFADFFIGYPKLALILNAIASLFAGVLACLLMSTHDQAFYMCIAVTVGSFLSAAGIHMTVLKLSPDPSISPSVNPDRVAKIENRRNGS